MRAAAWFWFVFAAVAALMGVLLLVSHEPGATAGRWYLGLTVLGAALGLWGFRVTRSKADAWFASASAAGVALVAVQAFVISAFAYQGLSTVLLVIALVATLAAVIVWWQDR
jgi:hypothetical protein